MTASSFAFTWHLLLGPLSRGLVFVFILFFPRFSEALELSQFTLSSDGYKQHTHRQRHDHASACTLQVPNLGCQFASAHSQCACTMSILMSKMSSQSATFCTTVPQCVPACATPAVSACVSHRHSKDAWLPGSAWQRRSAQSVNTSSTKLSRA